MHTFPFFNKDDEIPEALKHPEELEEEYDFTEDLGINTMFIKEDLDAILEETNETITDEEAEQFIEEYGADISEAMTEIGWEYLRYFLKLFFKETKRIEIQI